MLWFDLLALLFVLTAVFGWFNLRVLHLRRSVGMLLMGLAASVVLALVDVVWPDAQLYRELRQTLAQINFTKLVMDGMLAFLLFAGALNVNISLLRDRLWPVLLLALIGTLISTVVVATAFWGVAHLLGFPLRFIWALVFGALISPTDPIAVLSMLKHAKVPERLRVEMEGEALFNDGIGVVLFTTFVGVAMHGSGGDQGIGGAVLHLVWEVAGGLGLGACAGYLAYRMVRTVDDFPTEILITLALVTGTYALARDLGTSGPLAVVAAGLITSYRTRRLAMSDETERYVSGLWTVIDEVLNSVLFLLIGLEVVVLKFDLSTLVMALIAIPILLVARLIAVSAPVIILYRSNLASIRHVPFLAWGGIHGGISVALVLALPANPERSIMLAATYAVVLFTLLVQGPSLGWMAARTLPAQSRDEPD